MSQLPINQILYGDVLEKLRELPDECVDLIITSPPYHSMRDYGVEGQIGLEATFEEYLNKLLAVTAELKRVLKKTGQLWWNMGDGYGTSTTTGEFRDKCLMMMPERLAIRMIDEQGWILRNKVIYAKQIYIKKGNYTIGTALPTSTKDRFNETYEFFYFFVKSKRYYSNLDAVRIPYQSVDPRTDNGYLINSLCPNSKYNINPGYGGQKFNLRVRDAIRKAGQPQYVATQEEIERYKQETGKIKGGGANLNLPWDPVTGGTMYKIGRHVETERHKGIWQLDNFERQALLKQLANEYRGKFDGMGEEAEKYNSPRAREERVKARQKELAADGVIGASQRIRAFHDTADFVPVASGKNLPNIWQINPQPYNFRKSLGVAIDHFACFPEALCEIPILFGSPPDGIVLDPFCGSGTTLVVAKRFGRNFIGIELNPGYVEIAKRRLQKEFGMFAEELSE